MSKRLPAFPAPVAGAVVRKEAPALYWLLYEVARPRSCAVCPYSVMLSEPGADPMSGTATCKLGKHPIFIQDATQPECHDGNWQWRGREELGKLWARLMASDEELAEIAAELGSEDPAQVLADAKEMERQAKEHAANPLAQKKRKKRSE